MADAFWARVKDIQQTISNQGVTMKKASCNWNRIKGGFDMARPFFEGELAQEAIEQALDGARQIKSEIQEAIWTYEATNDGLSGPWTGPFEDAKALIRAIQPMVTGQKDSWGKDKVDCANLANKLSDGIKAQIKAEGNMPAAMVEFRRHTDANTGFGAITQKDVTYLLQARLNALSLDEAIMAEIGPNLPYNATPGEVLAAYGKRVGPDAMGELLFD